MRVVADLHLHSRFSLATSPRMGLSDVSEAAARKGVHLVGTGDCTHREWLSEARRLLRPDGDGAYSLGATRFLVTGEVSVVWRDEVKGRRVHLLLVLPSLAHAERVSAALSRFGSVESDGRPCLTTPVRDVVDAVWGAAPGALVIPAHVWTPWYSALGSRSGFDSLDECFGPYAERILAVETGLSSDPAMCRKVGFLDRLALVSFSDAHSPDRIGREATIFDLEEISFPAVAAALQSRARGLRTVELFAEEGKYYFDGHRACGVSLSPREARALDGRCPACGKPLTMGVLRRVEDLGDRRAHVLVPPFDSVVPLDEIVAHVLGLRAESRTVSGAVCDLVARFGTELAILLERAVDELRDGVLDGVADAIAAVRQGRVVTIPGYDGVYGRVVPESMPGPAR
jgi:DNA helicase II / ATP-dependent DNA helicase PcrA